MYRIYCLLFSLVIGSCSYLSEPITENPLLTIEENADYIKLTSSTVDQNKTGIVFYPGGLVDPHAYILALQDLVLEDDRMVVIIKAASNLAILNTQKATKMIKKIPEVSNWVVGGHSLGGAVACFDVSKNPDTYSGMFLLAAYSTKDLTDLNIPILSITGSEDQVLDQDKFQENAVNLPPGIYITKPFDIPLNGTIGSTVYGNILGANHAQFGSYGEQSGDGIAGMSMDIQQGITLLYLQNFLASNQL